MSGRGGHQDESASIEPRVEVVERQINDVRSQIGSLQAHVDRGFERITAVIGEGFKDRDARLDRALSQIGNKFDEQARYRNTNWSVVIAAVSLGVLIVGAIGSAYVLPLAKADTAHEAILAEHMRVINDLRDRESEQRAALARLDERSKFALYVGGAKPSKENP